MKILSVSNALYGTIWSHATEQDKSEEDILWRLLQIHAQPQPAPVPAKTFFPAEREQVGYIDPRFGVRFPQGFKIFRTYKGSDYKATASNGRWDLEGHLTPFESLAALSAFIGAKTENAWMGWRFIDEAGEAHFVDDLRNPDAVKQRKKEKGIRAALASPSNRPNRPAP
jgi:hypothetical protein